MWGGGVRVVVVVVVGKERCVCWGGKGGAVAVSTPLNQSGGCLPDRDLQLRADRHIPGGSVAYTPHGAYRLIPRLKFTFAPSRLNSHFSSSHNTPLSRDTGMMGFLLAAHAKYV